MDVTEQTKIIIKYSTIAHRFSTKNLHKFALIFLIMLIFSAIQPQCKIWLNHILFSLV